MFLNQLNICFFMKLEARGVICDTRKRGDSQKAASFVTLSAAESGTIFCVFQIGPVKNAATSTLLVYRSYDQGCSWQEMSFRFEPKINGASGSFSSGQIVETEPGKLLLMATWFDRSQPEQPFFDPMTEGILPTKQLMAFSTDEAETWTEWQILPIPGLQACSCTGPLLKWGDGVIGFPFENLKQFDDPKPVVPGAWCMVSKDRGRNFESPTLVARDPTNKIYFWDQRLSPGRKPGEFVGLFWTYDREKQQDLKIHCLRSSLFGDGSKARPFPTTLTGQIASPLWLGNGRLVAFVVERSCPGTLTLWSSNDEGISWPENLVVYRHEESLATVSGTSASNYAQYWEEMGKWSFGHPAILPLGGETVLLAYYAGQPNRTSIHWARVNMAMN
jgi:hypothetical protein